MIGGALAALASAGLWAGATVLFTAEGRRTRAEVMNLVKTLGASAIFLLVLAVTRGGASAEASPALLPAPRDIAWLLLSGVVGIGLGDTLYFVALRRIGARRSLMLGLLAAPFAALAAGVAGQPLPGPRGAAGIAVTLGGLLLFLRVAPLGNGAARGAAPAAARFRRAGLACGLGAALCQALGIVMTKGAIDSGGLLSASLLRLVAGAASVLLLEVARGRAARLGAELARGFARGRLLLAALLGTVVGFYLFQLAILLGSPPVTAALTATSPILAAPLAARYLGERLPRAAALGTLLAVAGVALVVLD